MFERLYCRAFQTDDSAFDNRKEYFLAFLNFINDERFKNTLSQGIAHYINNNCYLEQSFTSSQIADSDLGEFIRSRSRSRATASIETCYAVVFDGDSDITPEKIGEAIRIIAGASNISDKILLILSLSENSSANAFMKELDASRLPDNVVSYVFLKNKYREEEIVDNMCGALLLNIDRKEGRALNDNFSVLGRYVSANVASFPESGKQILSQRIPRVWTTFISTYNDEKRKFLKFYLYQLCKNATTPANVDFSHICSEYYEHQVYAIDITGWTRRLRRAIDMIPRMTINAPDTQQSLKSYFGQCYGMDGPDLVDLTMKVNLSKQPKYTQSTVSDAAFHLFKVLEQYNSYDLFEEVKEYLVKYLSHHKDLITNQARRLKEYISQDGDVSHDIHEYIRMYIEYNTEFRKQEFWTDVFAYIGKNKELFAEQCEKNRQLSNALAELTNSLSSAEPLALPVNVYPSFSASRLVNADGDREICEDIKATYEKYINSEQKDDELLDDIVRFPKLFYSNPSFYQDYEYEFTVRGKYTVTIKQRIGQYFDFYEL